MNSVSDLATPIVDQQGTTLLDLARLLKAGDQQSGIELSDFKARTAHELRRFGEDLARPFCSGPKWATGGPC